MIRDIPAPELPCGRIRPPPGPTCGSHCSAAEPSRASFSSTPRRHACRIDVVAVSGGPGLARRGLAACHGVPFVVDARRCSPRAAGGGRGRRPRCGAGAPGRHTRGWRERGRAVGGGARRRRVRKTAERAAQRTGPCCTCPRADRGLDALKAACIAGVDAVSIRVAKPPAAWKNIPYVMHCVWTWTPFARRAPLRWPGAGGCRTSRRTSTLPRSSRWRALVSTVRAGVVADPALSRNTHTIRVSGKSGNFTVVLENVPSPDNRRLHGWRATSALAAASRSARAFATAPRL